MRKLLLLFSVLSFSLSTFAQTPMVLYVEDFEDPNQNYKVTNGVTTAAGQTPATINFKDTNVYQTNGVNSYHIQGSETFNDVWFETDDFSTIGYPYVSLSFNHICKLFLGNAAYIEISTDLGTSWRILNDTAYKGTSALYPANEFFNEGGYIANNNLWVSGQDISPTNSWWVREDFDLRGYAYDTIANTGFTNVRLRFKARFNIDLPFGTGNFYDGWFLDSINVVGSVCELNAPTIDFNIAGSVCLDKPENRVVEDPSNNYKVSLLAKDVGAGMDRVELIWDNNGVIDTVIMTLVNAVTGEYTADITNVFLFDSIYWYVEAYDLSCPNKTRSPDAFVGDYFFWIDDGLPAKCGSPFCGALPTTISSTNFPWTEDFEGPEWGVGNNGATAGNDNQHRGSFPTYPDGYWNVQPSIANQFSNDFAWCVASTATSTPFTGPSSNHTGNGGSKYLYTEGSVSGVAVPALITPCIDLTTSTKCYAFEFYYHMFGDDINRIAIQVDTGSDGAAFYGGFTKIIGEQQSLSTDPWKRNIFSLEQFNGQYIRIRFLALRNGTGSESDIAIDDFRIFEPDPNEIEILSFESPVNGFCGYNANEPIEIIVRSNGCSTTSAIPLAFEVTHTSTGGVVSTVIERDTIFTPLGLGDTISHEFIPKGDLSSFGTFDIKSWSEMPGDNDQTNDTVFSQTIEHLPTISTFPFIEDFEDGVVGQRDVGNDNWRFDDGLDPTYIWQVGEDLTPTRSTGPFQGFHHAGKYLYTETHAGGQQVSTFFRSLCFDLTGLTNPTLDFFYHFYGADIAGMEIQVSKGDEALDTWTTIVGSNVGTSQTEETSDWKFKRVSLNAYAGQTIKLRFKANRSAGTDQADMAIDKIMVYDRLTKDAGAYLLDNPKRAVLVYTTPITIPTVQVINYGTTALTSLDVKIDITPYCGVNQGITASYSETLNSGFNIAPGTAAILPALSNININWPVGDFKITVYTSVTGDTHAFNDSITRDVTGVDLYTVPFDDSFDPCDHSSSGFYQGQVGKFYQWELGVPAASTINTAHSSPNVWSTNLDGNYYPGTDEYLFFPVLTTGMDTFHKIEYRMWHWMHFDQGSPASSAGVVEYLSGGQWIPLGGTNINQNIGINWLGSQFGTQLSNVFNGPGFEGASNGWIYSQYIMDEFNNNPGALIRLRMHFKSSDPLTLTPAQTRNGWALDDFELFVPGQYSGSPIKIKTVAPLPIPGQDQEFDITIKNTGAKIMDSVEVRVLVDGVQLGTAVEFYPMDPFMFRGQSTKIRFNDLWTGNTVTSGLHEVCVITSRPNDRIDGIQFDDTICVFIQVLGEVNMTTGQDSLYCNDFERLDPNIDPWIALNSETFDENHSWEYGSPTQVGSAFNGTNAWMTRLDSVYSPLDKSALFSPIFIVDSGQTYEISFQHWFDTEQYHDGGNFEVSFNGGLDWSPIGYKSPGDSNWYNTYFVTSLDIIKPGWTDTLKQWSLADYNIAFDNDGTKAIFRFRFAADYDINRAGWAIDQFCFTKTTDGAQQFIGREEYELPEELVIADLSPNPTGDFTELAIYSPTPKSGSYAIVNSIGQLMESKKINLVDGSNRIQLDGSKWNSGIYFIKIQIEGESFTKKLILTR